MIEVKEKYPLDAMISASNMQLNLDKIRQIMYAYVKFAVQGDDSLLSINGDQERTEALKQFREFYVTFFVSSFEWTKHNHDNICSDTQTIKMQLQV